MGKRELFIASAFVIVGMMAYQFTAPPPRPGETRFSFGRFWENARRGMHGNAAQATFKTARALPASAELTEVRLEGIMGRVRLVGEPRADVAYELTVQSTGPDSATALEYAKRVTVKSDDLGSGLTLRVDYPREGRQSVEMVVKVPARVGVRVSGANGLDASGLTSLHLDSVQGDSTVTRVAGALTGLHRNGSLTVTDAGSVKLSLQRSRASFERIAAGLTLDVRDGECHITDARGPVEVDETRAEISVTNPAGPVRVGGSEGRVVISNPRAESRIDMRRAEVEVQLSTAVPLTLLTTEEMLRLVLDGAPRIAIDAVAINGKIQSGDFGLQPETMEQESRLSHTFGAVGAPRVSLRNSRGDIIIKNSRGAIVDRERK